MDAVNVTDSGAEPLIGTAPTVITGASEAGVTETVTISVPIKPLLSLTANTALYVPANV